MMRRSTITARPIATLLLLVLAIVMVASIGARVADMVQEIRPAAAELENTQQEDER